MNKEVEKALEPKCKTCGDEKEVHFKYDDPEVEAIVNARDPCPDCQPEAKKPESDYTYTKKEIDEFIRESNRLLGDPKYKPKDLVQDYSKAIIICKELQAKLDAAEKENEKIRNQWHIDLNDKNQQAEEIKGYLECLEKLQKLSSVFQDNDAMWLIRQAEGIKWAK